MKFSVLNFTLHHPNISHFLQHHEQLLKQRTSVYILYQVLFWSKQTYMPVLCQAFKHLSGFLVTAVEDQGREPQPQCL